MPDDYPTRRPHSQAWNAAGDISPLEAKAKFLSAIRNVPGFETPAEEPVEEPWFGDLFSCSSWFPCFDNPAPKGLGNAIASPALKTPLNGLGDSIDPSQRQELRRRDSGRGASSFKLDSTAVAPPSSSALMNDIMGMPHAYTALPPTPYNCK